MTAVTRWRIFAESRILRLPSGQAALRRAQRTGTDTDTMTDATVTNLLVASIERVWNEHDDAKRLVAIREIYHADATIYEPERTVSGHEAISGVVAAVLADMPAGFRFEITGPTLGHHGVAVTRWEGGPPGQVIVSGADAARIVDGKIHEHWFFFDPAS